jgi:hypothetical protein
MNCSTCKYIHITTSHEAECRRFPPNYNEFTAMVKKPVSYSQYPVVYNYKLFGGLWQSACGEYKEGKVNIAMLANDNKTKDF